jgi:hypothetical protein
MFAPPGRDVNASTPRGRDAVRQIVARTQQFSRFRLSGNGVVYRGQSTLDS